MNQPTYLLLLGLLLLGCSPSSSALSGTPPAASPQRALASGESPAPQVPAVPLIPPTAEQRLPEQVPPAQGAAPLPPPPGAPGEAPPLRSGGNAPSGEVAPPGRAWAAQELARRGFERDPGKRVVAIDPGHGGPEVGAAQGRLAEKNVNLAIAQRLRALLEAESYQVVLTREADERAYLLPEAAVENPRFFLRADLQSRIDLANAARADIFVSVHNNGSSNTAEAGTEVWYAPDRPFGDKNWLLASEVLHGILGQLRAAGYDAPNRGLKNGSQFRVFGDRVFPLFVLGNARTEPRATRATEMPGALGESLFLSNHEEAALLGQERIQEAIARGYLQGIRRYFAQAG